MGDGFYRSKDPTNSIKVLKEKSEIFNGGCDAMVDMTLNNL